MARKKHYKRTPRSNTKWTDIIRENDKWETYYKQLNLFNGDDAEWESFKLYFQKDLPLTFRITGSRKHANEIFSIFKEKHLPTLTNVEFEGQEIKAPVQLPWYPDHFAWQLDVPKKVIRKNEQFAKTQRFLVLETASGNISRQEAVSMIPPLLLNVESHHSVLDMCAAPGSKTAQLIESLHKDTDEPTGFVIANDSDMRRSYMMVHQLKRINSANYLVVNHDAQYFPRIQLDKLNKKNILKFDRILCDVPCSGDGTMRKNVNIWNDWTYQNGLGLQALQYNILNRGLQLLQAGGKLVYSTCSLNPIENEAVIAQALRKWGDDIKLVDCSHELPGLIRSRGLSQWNVVDRNGEKKNNDDETKVDSWFPPSEEERQKFNLDRCVRVYPHQQNTGGFFIAVIEKKEQAVEKEINEDLKVIASGVENISTKKTEESTKEISESKKEKVSLPLDAINEPFVFIDPAHEVLKSCWKFYGISEDYDKTTCLVRSHTGEPNKTIFKVCPRIRDIIQCNDEKLKVIYSGVKFLVYQRSDIECAWRIHSEVLPSLKHHLGSERIIAGDMDTLKVLFTEPFPALEFFHEAKVDPNFIEQVKSLSSGCAFVKVSREDDTKEDLLVPVWVGVNSINVMISKESVHELLYRIYGIETKATDNPKAR